MRLFGSTTSPYVRRIRLLLADKPYEFVNWQIFEDDHRSELRAKNPTMKIPMIEDEGTVIYDSRVIYRYLCDKFEQPSLSWDQENLLTLIDAANDSLVSVFLLRRSGLDTQQDKLFFNLQNERLIEIFAALEAKVEEGDFTDWHYPAICLFCLLDWVVFRELFDLSEHRKLRDFREQYLEEDLVLQTDPR